MPAALGLQKEIYRTYALAKFGKPDIRKLSRTDRRRSEIVVKVEKGSANFIMALDVIINWITRTEMTPEPAIAIVGLATVFGGGRYAKSIVNNREETKRTELEAKKLVFLSQEETECARIIAGKARENVVLKESLDRYKTPFEHVMRSLDPDDTLSVNDQEIIDGETARQLFRARPETIEEVRLDGFFVILWVSSGAQRDGYRARVRRVQTDWKLLLISPALRSPRTKRASCKRASGKRGPYTCASTPECVVGKLSPQSSFRQAWKIDPRPTPKSL